MTTQEILELAGHRQVPPWVMKLVADCLQKEREACAKLADVWVRAYDHPSEVIARSIRARGQQVNHPDLSDSCTNSNLPLTCKTHPDAPHGFVRNASHNLGRDVCECEFWEPTEDSSITEDEVNIRSRLYQRIHELETEFKERNFCSRCGKRLGQNDWDIHTCSLPEREISISKSSVTEESVPIGKYLWRKRQ